MHRSSAFWLQCSGAFASLRLSVRYRGLLFCATHSFSLSPAFVGIFCPRLLLAAFSELVVGRHADFRGGPEKKLVLHRDVLKRIWGLSFTCDAYC